MKVFIVSWPLKLLTAYAPLVPQLGKGNTLWVITFRDSVWHWEKFEGQLERRTKPRLAEAVPFQHKLLHFLGGMVTRPELCRAVPPVSGYCVPNTFCSCFWRPQPERGRNWVGLRPPENCFVGCAPSSSGCLAVLCFYPLQSEITWFSVCYVQIYCCVLILS
jgi:hypothetical protein